MNKPTCRAVFVAVSHIDASNRIATRVPPRRQTWPIDTKGIMSTPTNQLTFDLSDSYTSLVTLLERAAAYTPNVIVTTDDAGAYIEATSGDWSIYLGPDPESARLTQDEPYASVTYNSSATYNDPDLGQAVERGFSGTSLAIHEQFIQEWTKTFHSQATTKQRDPDAPAPWVVDYVAETTPPPWVDQ